MIGPTTITATRDTEDGRGHEGLVQQTMSVVEAVQPQVTTKKSPRVGVAVAPVGAYGTRRCARSHALLNLRPARVLGLGDCAGRAARTWRCQADQTQAVTHLRDNVMLHRPLVRDVESDIACPE